MSTTQLIANLRNKVSALSTSIVTTKGDLAWGPVCPIGHTPYTWGIRGTSTLNTNTPTAPAPKPVEVAPKKVEAPKQAAKPAAEKPKKAAPAPVAEGPYDAFYKLDLRVGQVTNVRDHPGAESLYLFDAVIGANETVQVVTNLKKSMTKEELEGKFLVFICNLKPASMRGEKSFAMIMGGANADGVHGLLVPGASPVAGDRLSVEGSTYPEAIPGRANDKAIAAAFEKLSTNDKFELTFDGKVVSVSNGPIVMPDVKTAIFAIGK